MVRAIQFNTFIIWQKNQLKKYNVNVYLNTELTDEIIKKEKPDILIIATGSKPFLPPIKGLDSGNVVVANDVLLGKCEVGQNVAIIGGGLVGAETAEHLAVYGKKVTIIEMLDQIVKDGEFAPTHFLLKNLKENGVDIYTSAKVKEINPNSVIFEYKSEERKINADTVVIAAGIKAFNELEEKVGSSVPEVIVVGDASSCKNGYKNIQEGFIAGLNV